MAFTESAPGVVGIGKGTKMLGNMLSGSKKYTTVGELGKATDTLDATGTGTEEKAYDLSTCAHVKDLIRSKQGPFTLQEHVLHEDKWTIDAIAQSIQDCMCLFPTEPDSKRLKTDSDQPSKDSQAVEEES
ncbi:UNVERIFIED_CONTAM: hypothetical protein FKN15_039101 [Acipenser sinensis]